MLTILICLLLLAAPAQPSVTVLGDCTPHEAAHDIHDCGSDSDF